MDISITGRNMGITDRFRDYATEKGEKVEHLADRAQVLEIKVSRHHEKNGHAGDDRVEMTLIGPGPIVPYLGSFVEINVRTYVTDTAGHRGVWFFSLDVPRSPIVGVARTAFSLPYCWSAAGHTAASTPAGEHHRYWATRRWPRSVVSNEAPACDIRYTMGERLADGDVSELDHFVTAQWSLFTVRGKRLGRGRLVRGDVDHARWPIHRVLDHRIDQTLIEAAGLSTPEGAPHALASPGVGVQVAWFQEVDAR